MTDLLASALAPEDPAAAKDAAHRRVARDLAAHCRVIADNLARSIEMAEARGADTTNARCEIEAWIDFEQSLMRRCGSRVEHVRYDPGLKARHIGATGG